MPANISVDTIKTSQGKSAFDVAKFATLGGYSIKQSIVQVYSTAINTISTVWIQGPIFPATPLFTAGSLIKLTYNVPVRNDSTAATWGGMYLEPQIQLNSNGTWLSLGSSGATTVMTLGDTGNIGHYKNTLVIDPASLVDFTVTTRIMVRTHDNALGQINGSNQVNAISSTAPLMAGNNSMQHYCKVILEEIRKY